MLTNPICRIDAEASDSVWLTFGIDLRHAEVEEIYAAYRICQHFPELIAELEEHLDMMQCQTLSPGLKSALRQTKTKIAKLADSRDKCRKI